MRAVERRPVAYSDHDIVQPVQVAGMILHIPSCTDAKLQVASDIDQRSRHSQITSDSITLDLHEKTVSPEDFLAVLRELSGRDQSIVFQCSGQQAIPARAGQDDESVMPFFECCERQSRIEPLRAEVRGGEQAAEIRVALRCLGEQNQLAAIGQRDCGAGDRLNTEWLGRVRERERAVDAVAIGEREGGIAVAMRFGENLIRR